MLQINFVLTWTTFPVENETTSVFYSEGPIQLVCLSLKMMFKRNPDILRRESVQLSQVVTKQNLGDYLNETYKDRTKMKQVSWSNMVKPFWFQKETRFVESIAPYYLPTLGVLLQRLQR